MIKHFVNESMMLNECFADVHIHQLVIQLVVYNQLL